MPLRAVCVLFTRGLAHDYFSYLSELSKFTNFIFQCSQCHCMEHSECHFHTKRRQPLLEENASPDRVRVIGPFLARAARPPSRSAPL
jgi:hypothetical protein